MKYQLATFDLSNEKVYAIIREIFGEDFELLTLTDGSLADRIKTAEEADFILSAVGAIPTEAISRAKRLRMIQHQGVGVDKTDVSLATERGIEVCITPEGTSIGVSEHVILMILALYKKLRLLSNAMYEGHFYMWDYRTDCYEIYGKTVGYYGYGRIAREVKKRLDGFGAKGIFYDPFLDFSEAEEKEQGITQVRELEEFLSRADIVTLHLPSTPETRGSIDKRFFHLMKTQAILINTARGDLIVEEDFVRAIRENWIAGAGLDVFAKEPLPADSPLLTLPNVLFTPHVSAGTVDALRTKLNHCKRNILAFLDGRETEYSLNKAEIATQGREK